MKKPSAIDKEIGRLEELLLDLDPDTKEYKKVLQHLDSLHELRDRNKSFRLKINGDTIVLASVNLLGILLVLHHERFHAVSSKALGFIIKPRP